MTARQDSEVILQSSSTAHILSILAQGWMTYISLHTEGFIEEAPNLIPNIVVQNRTEHPPIEILVAMFLIHLSTENLFLPYTRRN